MFSTSTTENTIVSTPTSRLSHHFFSAASCVLPLRSSPILASYVAALPLASFYGDFPVLSLYRSAGYSMNNNNII